MGNYIAKQNYKSDYNILRKGDPYHLDMIEEIGECSLYYMTNQIYNDIIIFCDIDIDFDSAFESIEYTRHKNSMEILFNQNI